MTEVYLGLGSNLGDRKWYLFQALAELVKLGPLERSNWYESEPVDMPGAPLFLNGAVRLWTELTVTELYQQTLEIERGMGRNDKGAAVAGTKLPRVIDIDILFYGQEVINLPGLVVPHPRLHERAFVLLPLAELAPQFWHPVLGLTVQELLARVNLDGVKRCQDN
ncbi:MAG: 2-amino-4-hydroxy-6-hydroxymethyldihydropteridine diphosphokinase [bacterium]